MAYKSVTVLASIQQVALDDSFNFSIAWPFCGYLSLTSAGSYPYVDINIFFWASIVRDGKQCQCELSVVLIILSHSHSMVL